MCKVAISKIAGRGSMHRARCRATHWAVTEGRGAALWENRCRMGTSFMQRGAWLHRTLLAAFKVVQALHLDARRLAPAVGSCRSLRWGLDTHWELRCTCLGNTSASDQLNLGIKVFHPLHEGHSYWVCAASYSTCTGRGGIDLVSHKS